MSNENPCPVSVPKLLKAKSTVVHCASCGAWVRRYPDFLGEDDVFWECERCNNTSQTLREGRPYGKKSRQWAQIVEWFNDCCFDIPPWDWDTVETDPPMSSLDWKALERWYRSQNIYHVFIGFEEMAGYED
jgi:hypothetical protein